MLCIQQVRCNYVITPDYITRPTNSVILGLNRQIMRYCMAQICQGIEQIEKLGTIYSYTPIIQLHPSKSKGKSKQIYFYSKDDSQNSFDFLTAKNSIGISCYSC